MIKKIKIALSNFAELVLDGFCLAIAVFSQQTENQHSSNFDLQSGTRVYVGDGEKIKMAGVVTKGLEPDGLYIVELENGEIARFSPENLLENRILNPRRLYV